MSWRHLSTCPFAMRDPRSIALPDGRVLVIAERAAFLLDPVADRWEPTQPTIARDRGFAITDEGWVLACGGAISTRLIDNCDLFRPDTNTWLAMPPLPVPTDNLSCATVRGRVVVTGGWALTASGAQPSSATYSWAPGDDHWERHADAPFAALDPFAIAIADGMVLHYAGRLARFDGAWSTIDGDFSGAAIAPIDAGFVVAGGGRRENEASAMVRVWNNGWSARPELPKPRKNARAVRVDNRVAIIGGVWTEKTWEELYDPPEIDRAGQGYYNDWVVHDRPHVEAVIESAGTWVAVPAPDADGHCHALPGGRVIVMADPPALWTVP